MLFARTQKKMPSPWLTIAVGALAAVGVMSIASSVKRMVKRKMLCQDSNEVCDCGCRE